MTTPALIPQRASLRPTRTRMCPLPSQCFQPRSNPARALPPLFLPLWGFFPLFLIFLFVTNIQFFKYRLVKLHLQNSAPSWGGRGGEGSPAASALVVNTPRSPLRPPRKGWGVGAGGDPALGRLKCMWFALEGLGGGGGGRGWFSLKK